MLKEIPDTIRYANTAIAKINEINLVIILYFFLIKHFYVT